MKKKYGIALFTVVMLVALSIAYQFEYNHVQKQQEQAKKETEKEKPENVVSAQGEAVKEEIYYLAELNGYVVVYQEDRNTVYEYTDILVNELPDEVRNEVRSGMKIVGTDKLYGFLENYTS